MYDEIELKLEVKLVRGKIVKTVNQWSDKYASESVHMNMSILDNIE